jgi:CRISPR/Cas system-associated endonuclease Cas1
MRDALGFPVPISERISVIYIEKCVLERDGHSLVMIDAAFKTIIPVAKTTVIMMGGCQQLNKVWINAIKFAIKCRHM